MVTFMTSFDHFVSHLNMFINYTDGNVIIQVGFIQVLFVKILPLNMSAAFFSMFTDLYLQIEFAKLQCRKEICIWRDLC